MSNQLIKSTGNAVVVAKPDYGAIAKVKVTRAVGEGIKALQVAFPTMSQTPDDRALVMKLYAEAVDGFHPAEQEFALRWLRLHNPRNTPTFTQPPTPQDLHECCGSVHKTWVSRVIGHFMGYSTASGTEHLPWGEEPYGSYFSSRRSTIPWGEEPLSATCDIPDDIVIEAMRDATSTPHRTDHLVNMSPEHYAKLRAEFFAEGRQAEIDAKRQAKAEAEEKARKEQEYLNSLPLELRAARSEVALRYWRMVDFDESRMPAEEQLIAEAKALLAQQAEERAQRYHQWKADWERRRKERLEMEGNASEKTPSISITAEPASRTRAY